jgi:hypothetical protein
MNQKSFSLLVLLIVLVLGSGCAHGHGVQNHPAPWKFAVISDTQGADREKADQNSINEPVLREIAQDVAVEHPGFIIVAGDLVTWSSNTGFSAQYANWKSAMEPVRRISRIEVYQHGLPWLQLQPESCGSNTSQRRTFLSYLLILN